MQPEGDEREECGEEDNHGKLPRTLPQNECEVLIRSRTLTSSDRG